MAFRIDFNHALDPWIDFDDTRDQYDNTSDRFLRHSGYISTAPQMDFDDTPD